MPGPAGGVGDDVRDLRRRTGSPRPSGTRPGQVFLNPAARDLYPEWPAVAATTVANLRPAAGTYADHPEPCALVGELSLKREDFRRLRADHEVRECAYGVKKVRHPVAGLLTLPYETLAVGHDPERTIVVYTPEPDSETAERLALPGSWATVQKAFAGTAAPPLPGGGTTAVPARDAGRVRAGLARPWRPWRSGSRSGGPWRRSASAGAGSRSRPADTH